MNVIVCGAGQVGSNIARHLATENNQVTVIDQSPELVRKLTDKADIVIENFKPGGMDEQGFGYAELSSTNARLIYCSLKGFLSGPYSHRTALDEVTQMMGGLAYMTGLPDKPMRAGSSVIDITGGMFGVIGILAALDYLASGGQTQATARAAAKTA